MTALPHPHPQPIALSYKPVEQVISYARNARTHSDRQVEERAIRGGVMNLTGFGMVTGGIPHLSHPRNWEGGHGRGDQSNIR